MYAPPQHHIDKPFCNFPCGKIVVFRDASGLTLTELTQLLNLAFSDYFLPMQLTEEQMKLHIAASGIDLTQSVVVSVGAQQYAGFSFLAVR